MGNILSASSSENAATAHKSQKHNMGSESETMEDVSNKVVTEEQFYDTVSDDDTRAKLREEEMDEFRKQLSVKREQRREILTRHRTEKKELEAALHNEIKSKVDLCENNRLLRELLLKNNVEIPEEIQCDQQPSFITDSISHMAEEIDKLKSTNVALRCDLAKTNSSLQAAYSDIAELSEQNHASIKQVNALKEVITVSKTMIGLREQQLNELKAKLNEIEQSLADRETSMLSTNLREEYERQLQNIRTLRGLYEERARLADVSRQALSRELDEHKVLLEAETNKNKNLTEKVNDLEAKVNVLEETVEDKNNTIASCQRETRGIKAEMSAVNKLFSQVLLGYKNKQDLDTLVHRLQENHGILTQMAGKEDTSEVSSELPKLLLEIVSQIDEPTETTAENCIDSPGVQNTTAEEIVENLPKVWRVLIELLSHQSETDTKSAPKVTTCYKSVETKSGPVLVPSVSQTYIRLKDLILEKLALIKEVNRMKQLNTHLESRLGEQERRLCLVTNELSKTWNVVGRLRRHHHQLHTHEKILKYELQQKRKLLNELKEELEYCREKWEQAREKNTQSEKDWKKLRTEFSNRKLKPDLASINNSAESGYSDEKPSDESSESNDESEYVEPKVKCKKKLKKSFETNVDSSADFNLAAEREDPASDMLDVADLPLDTQEDIHECDDVSDSFNSESLFKNEKLCEETEDEAADITNEDNSITERSPDYSLANIVYKEENLNNQMAQNDSNVPGTVASSTNVQMTTNQAETSKSIREQNERPALRDKRLEKIENSETTETIAKYSDQINNTQDSILSLPTSSRQNENESNPSKGIASDIDIISGSMENVKSNTIKVLSSSQVPQKAQENTGDSNADHQIRTSNSDLSKQNDNITANVASTLVQVTDTIKDAQNVDFSTILENVRKQNERLEIKDKRLYKLEQGCFEVVENISNTLSSGSAMIAKLEDLHEKCNGKETILQQGVNSNENSDLIPEITGTLSTNDQSLSLQETDTSTNAEIVNFSAILANVRKQDEHLKTKDERLEKLEQGCSKLVENYSKTLDSASTMIAKLNNLHEKCNEEETIPQQEINENEYYELIPVSEDRTRSEEPTTSREIDHEARFAARDLRLKRLEEQTKSLVNKVNKTTSKGVKIHYKLEELHNIYGSENSRSGTPSEDTEENSQNDDDMPTE